MTNKPRVSNSASEKEMEKVEKQLESFENQVKDLTLDRMNEAPRMEFEPQTKISSQDLEKSRDIYLRPDKVVNTSQRFNEKFRESYNYDKEYVKFIAENYEIKGEAIEIWTRPYGGMPAEFWKVPCNKPVWGPRYLAEQIKRKCYHRLVMQQNQIVGTDHTAQYFGNMVADTTVQRLDAIPVSGRKSIFMGASNF